MHVSGIYYNVMSAQMADLLRKYTTFMSSSAEYSCTVYTSINTTW